MNEKILEEFDKLFVSEDVTGGQCWSISGRAVYEVKAFILKSLSDQRAEIMREVEKKQNEVPNIKVCTYKGLDLRIYCDGRDDAFDEVLSIIHKK